MVTVTLSGRKRKRLLRGLRHVARHHKRGLFDKQNGICAICHESMVYRKATVDHIEPLGKGGSSDVRNLQVAHAACNNERHSDEDTSLWPVTYQFEMQKLYVDHVLYGQVRSYRSKYRKNIRRNKALAEFVAAHRLAL